MWMPIATCYWALYLHNSLYGRRHRVLQVGPLRFKVTCPQAHSQQGAEPVGLSSPTLCAGLTSPADTLKTRVQPWRDGPRAHSSHVWSLGPDRPGSKFRPTKNQPRPPAKHNEACRCLTSSSATRGTAPGRGGCLRSGARRVRQPAQPPGQRGAPGRLALAAVCHDRFPLGPETM